MSFLSNPTKAAESSAGQPAIPGSAQQADEDLATSRQVAPTLQGDPALKKLLRSSGKNPTCLLLMKFREWLHKGELEKLVERSEYASRCEKIVVN